MNKSFKKILLLSFATLFASCNSNKSTENPSLEEFSSSNSEYSQISSQDSVPTLSEPVTVNVYAVNDFHGAILEGMNGRYYEGGLAKVFGYLKQQKDKDPEHTIIISSGDMFQGSLESNLSYGNIIVETMNYVGFSAYTLGNHDFDYGLDKLYDNIELANFPFLAGNIVNYKDRTDWDKVNGSVVLDLPECKVGIIGNIGYGQTTSIISTVVEDLYFDNPTSYIKKESDLLKKKGCKLIISSVHDGIDEVNQYGDLSSYINGMFCGHTHSAQRRTLHNTPYLQGACNGEYISHMQFTINTDNSVNVNVFENIDASSKWVEDEGIIEIQNRYLNSDYQKLVQDEIGQITDTTYLGRTEVANLSAKAMYDYAQSLGYDVAVSIQGNSRAVLPTPFTYSNLYKSLPFTNKMLIVRASGYSIKHESTYTYTYTEDLDSYSTLEDKQDYLIAIVDYSCLHQNIYKNYDAFVELNGEPERIIASYENYPVDITADYIKNTLHGEVKVSNCFGTNKGFNIYS